MSEVTAVPLRPVSRAGVVMLWIGIILFVVAGLALARYTSRKAVVAAMPPSQFLIANGARTGVRTTPSGLEYEVLKDGTGPTPGSTDVARIEYRGTLLDGTQFDATDKGSTRDLPVGQVIPGFGEALTLMPKGSRYRIWIPPELGYGPSGQGVIPPNSVLVFEITLHDFGSVPEQQQQMPGMPGTDGQ
jgi:FKBP-type peptidyl-prolyl cis-trans isomerase